jgi:hypothetical protein
VAGQKYFESSLEGFQNLLLQSSLYQDMAVSTVSAPAGKTAKKAVPAKRAPLSRAAQVAKQTPPVPQAANGVSPFEIMAGRIANRVAEMAENVTFVERQPYVMIN